MKKSLKITLSIIAAIIIILLCGISIYNSIEKAHGNTLPMPFGVGIAITETGSMEPNMPQGSLVVIVKDNSYEIDDIVAFRKDGESIHTVHRIVDISGDTVTTCGDANNGSCDDPITTNDIKGKVAFNIPKLGFALKKAANFIKQPITLIVLFLVITVGLYFSFKPKNKAHDDRSIEDIKAEIDKLKNSGEDQK